MFKDLNLGESMKGFVNPDQIMKLAKGVKFPTNKQELVNSFRNNNAPNEILSLIEKLPDKTYNSPQDLISSLKGSIGGS